MSNLTRGQIWVARSLIPMSIGVAAICFIAWRPYEKVASASVPEVTFSNQGGILAPGTSEPHLELVKVTKSKKYVTKIVKISDTPCWENTPGSSSKWVDTVQGPVGQVLVTTCR